MLVLRRKKGESILIGSDIKIIITDIDLEGRTVKVGIEAPRDTKVLRTEISNRGANHGI
ncbi:MAG: carbon storage regulator [Deltaproteobacteria bacterium]|nr:MAG: carbon storage regulator [Deltaproteobacteria bacterium]